MKPTDALPSHEIAIPEMYVIETAPDYWSAAARALSKQYPGYAVRVSLIAPVAMFVHPVWKGDQ